jgi:hypothetical protein
MDRKALTFIIIVLSALVILTLVHFNQQAVAPVPSPTPSATLNIPVTMPAKIDQYQNTTPPENATITPVPDMIKYNTRSSPKASVAAQASALPTAVPAMQPWKPMNPWAPANPMTPAVPMGAMTPMLPHF